MKKAGGKVVRTDVGDRYVVEEMRSGGYNLGGEQSGHMIFLDHNTTGDGIQSALQVLAIMRRTGEKPFRTVEDDDSVTAGAGKCQGLRQRRISKPFRRLPL